MATDWEERWRAGETGWDHGRAAPPLLEFLRREAIEGRVLVPGCGAGHEVRALAAGGAEVIGIDVAPTALRVARGHAAVGAERYEECDWLGGETAALGRFDWVVEHTCFCAIDPGARPAYVRSLRDVLSPGGHFLGIFYLNPASPSGPPFGVTPGELDGLFADFELLRRWSPGEAFESRVGREQMRLLRWPG